LFVDRIAEPSKPIDAQIYMTLGEIGETPQKTKKINDVNSSSTNQKMFKTVMTAIRPVSGFS